jgi:hypothetical protein
MSEMRNGVHIQDDDLELYARGEVKPNNTSALEGHLLACFECRERLCEYLGLCVKLTPSGSGTSKGRNKRSEVRFDTGDEAIFQELNPLSLERLKVSVVDVSRNGLGIIASKSVMPGTIVLVRMKDNFEMGEVRHCSVAGESYRIGLKLNPRQ